MNDKSPFPPAPESVTGADDDILIAPFNVEAVYVDRLIVNCTGGMVRVTLAEANGRPNNVTIRSAFVLTNANAKLMVDLIQRMVQQQESLQAGANAVAVAGDTLQ